MDIRLKRLDEQVIVITGATSGIGLVTARRAASRGARLVLVARNVDALDRLVAELGAQGCEAQRVVADVGREGDVRSIADCAIERFGGFDTWVNNAGVSVYGRLDQVPLDDMRRVFDTNFWGAVHGSRVAAEHLRQRAGGAVINVGSQLSDHAVPLQGIYAASKHAIKGFTDSLRLELELEGAPVSVTLIKPAGIDSMFLPHAKNYMDVEPRLPPPVYAPEVAADAILHAAEHPVRDLFVGGVAALASAAARSAPALFDLGTRRLLYEQQRSSRPAVEERRDNLHAAGSDLRERGSAEGPVLESSAYTRAAMRLAEASGTALAIGLGMAMLAAWGIGRPRPGPGPSGPMR